MYCKKCGRNNNDNAQFCVGCGQPLEQLQQSVPKKKRTRTLMFSVIGMVAVLIVILLCVIFMLVLPVRKSKEITHQLKQEVQEDENSGKEADDVTEETPSLEEVPATEKPSLTMDECAEICERMGGLEYSKDADENLLSGMAYVALQMEYAKDGMGAPKKLYTNLGEDDETILLFHIFNDFAYRQDIAGLAEYEMYQSGDSGMIINRSAAQQFLGDFYGEDQIDFSRYSYFEEQGDEYVSFIGGDGEPWYSFENYSIKEKDDFYLLEGACTYEDNSGEKYFTGYAKYLFKKRADSPLGATLLYSEFDYQENGNLAISASASSTLKGQGDKTYHASNLLDGKINTCWVEGVSGTGVDETIKIHFGEKKTVYGLTIFNGYLESKYLYGINGKVTRVSVSAPDGSVIQSDLMVPKYEEEKEPFETYDLVNFETWINFDYPVCTDTITITIEGATAGSKYEDTCISEIRVY